MCKFKVFWESFLSLHISLGVHCYIIILYVCTGVFECLSVYYPTPKNKGRSDKGGEKRAPALQISSKPFWLANNMGEGATSWTTCLLVRNSVIRSSNW